MSEAETTPVVLERYELQKQLQARDHTHTWQAQDLHNQQQVIVKILEFGENADWQAYTLFEREAQALQSLKHPRIPHLLAFRQEAQQVFLVQAAIAGESLRERMQNGWKVTETQARQLASEILELLHLLHSQAPPLIHRDIKPENLLLDDDNHPYLIDFGAVRQFAQNSYTVAGSFQYMAPEQLQGKAEPTSDLYALGMTLIELLSGSPLEDLPREGLYLQFKGAIHVSEGFKRWLEHLVAPYPVQRFDSAQAAIAALQAPEHLQELEQRGKLGPSHGKQELAPHIWIKANQEALELEFKGQKKTLGNALYFFTIIVASFSCVFSPFILMVLNDYYRWVRLPFSTLGNLLVMVGVMHLGVIVDIWLVRRFLCRVALQHELKVTENEITHRYFINRGLRRSKIMENKIPLKQLKQVTLGPYQVNLKRNTGLFKNHRFTLLVPFDSGTRKQVALALAEKGITSHVR